MDDFFFNSNNACCVFCLVLKLKKVAKHCFLSQNALEKTFPFKLRKMQKLVRQISYLNWTDCIPVSWIYLYSLF